MYWVLTSEKYPTAIRGTDARGGISRGTLRTAALSSLMSLKPAASAARVDGFDSVSA